MARRSKNPAALPSSAPLALPTELTIYTVGELHTQWLAWMGEHTGAADAAQPARVQATAVDQVDAAGLQLLLALQRALTAHGRQLHIEDPSEVLRQGCDALGLGSWLRGQTPAGAALSGADA